MKTQLKEHVTLDETLNKIARLAKTTSKGISANHKAKYSQYFTEGSVAKQMAAMLQLPNGAVIGDHGAGTGLLGGTVIASKLNQADALNPCVLRAYEIDDLLHSAFHQSMEEVCSYAKSIFNQHLKLF